MSCCVKMNDEKNRQTEITEFFDFKPQLSKKPRKIKTIGYAREFMEKSLTFLLESLKENSIDFQRIQVFVINTLREMEKKGICYMKVMPNKRVRVFKKFYCCFDVATWKRCPKYRCIAWPCEDENECPHHPRGDETIIEAETVGK